ncbi:MAG: hypothetical protein QOI86_3047, partial [Actinomycetota bacterium]|nr:hypothetical protein [Actinomycetota bacterium]
MTDTPVPAGIEAAGVTAWFETHSADVVPPLRFCLIAGGRSNFTYTVTDSADQRFVLRRPPLGPLLPSAHDMGREHRVIAALGASPVPVPPVVGLCTDETVTGAPFYVMRFVDGLILRDPEAISAVPDRIRVAASEALVDVLAALHDVDPETVGLGDLGRRDGYVERTLRRWRGQWEKSKSREIPLVEEVAERLAARIPPAGPARIVHGDYRLDNVIVAPDDGAGLDVVEGGQHIDQRLGRRPTDRFGDRFDDLGVAQDQAVHEAHDVERCPRHRVVGAQADHGRDGHGGAGQGGHDAVL